jgi:thermostable 8-oxoguanine DNA glycosylase
VNSKNEEAILEFEAQKNMKDWQNLIEKRADEIDSFLKKDKFRFGTFGSINANQIMS